MRPATAHYFDAFHWRLFPWVYRATDPRANLRACRIWHAYRRKPVLQKNFQAYRPDFIFNACPGCGLVTVRNGWDLCRDCHNETETAQRKRWH